MRQRVSLRKDPFWRKISHNYLEVHGKLSYLHWDSGQTFGTVPAKA